MITICIALSEAFSRKWPILGPTLLAGIFSIASGAAKDVQTLLITRFCTGFFGSALVTHTGSVLADIWRPTERGYAIMAYSLAVVIGPTIAPVVGGAITQGGLGWRWTQYVCNSIPSSIARSHWKTDFTRQMAGILTLTIAIVDAFVICESYELILLVRKAGRLRAASGNWALHAEFEVRTQRITVKYYINNFAIRPFAILATPICFFISIYASFIFGVFYASLAAFPIIYEEGRGWNKLVGTFPFFVLLVGVYISSVVGAFNQWYYNRRYNAPGCKVIPEARLLSMMFGSAFFAGGLFILGWTAEKEERIASFTGIALMGYGFFTIFQSALNYLVDTFKTYGASAIATNTFLRSSFTALFPLFIEPMYHRLGTNWATSVFGLFATVLIPIPFVLFTYGERIRARGRYSREVL